MTKKSKSSTAVKPEFEINEANEELFKWGGRLYDLRHEVPDFDGSKRAAGYLHVFPDGPAGAQYHWLDPKVFEKLCDEDAALQGAVRQARKANYSPESLAKVEAQVRNVYVEQYIPAMIALCELAIPTYARYFVAKALWKQLHPKDFDEHDEPVLHDPDL